MLTGMIKVIPAFRYQFGFQVLVACRKLRIGEHQASQYSKKLCAVSWKEIKLMWRVP